VSRGKEQAFETRNRLEAKLLQQIVMSNDIRLRYWRLGSIRDSEMDVHNVGVGEYLIPLRLSRFNIIIKSASRLRCHVVQIAQIVHTFYYL
jgi:hypothetical protein